MASPWYADYHQNFFCMAILKDSIGFSRWINQNDLFSRKVPPLCCAPCQRSFWMTRTARGYDLSFDSRGRTLGLPCLCEREDDTLQGACNSGPFIHLFRRVVAFLDHKGKVAAFGAARVLAYLGLASSDWMIWTLLLSQGLQQGTSSMTRS